MRSELLELNCTATGAASTTTRLLDAADRQRQVDGDVAALLHAHVLLLGRLEALQLRDDRVRAGIDEVEQVAPFGIGVPCRRDAGRVVVQRDRDARQRALAFVHDRALHASAIVLRAGRQNRQRQMAGDGDDRYEELVHDDTHPFSNRARM